MLLKVSKVKQCTQLGKFTENLKKMKDFEFEQGSS